MINKEVFLLLKDKFPGGVLEIEGIDDLETVDFIPIVSGSWFDIASFLKEDENLSFDSLQCITGVDPGVEANLEVRYNLHSMKTGKSIEIRIETDRSVPSVPSIETIWRVGDWFEREVYDMYGIIFSGHRDLRRMLLPEDWVGWPLRKDYETPETYHGIVVPKVKEEWE